MPKIAKELNALAINRSKHPGGTIPVSINVGGVSGLMLQITTNGGKSWLLRTMVGGKRREIGLGAYPEISLSEARDKARAAKSSIRQGNDPIEERKIAKATLLAAQKRGLTFNEAVESYLESKLHEFKNNKHKQQWRSTLDTYAKPVFGEMLVQDINVHDLLRALEPIWTSKTETASRLRGRIESILAWATVKGHRIGDNPARWKSNLSEILPKISKVANSKHHPAIQLKDASAWFLALQKKEGISARALEFLSITAARSGEVRGATWNEIDLSSKLWTIPANRMKVGKEHRVPLTQNAIALLKSLSKQEGSNFIFAAPRGKALSDMSLSAVMRRMQEYEEEAGHKGWLDRVSSRPAVPHGLRSTFRDWAAEKTDYPRDMAEIALAHTVGNEVERAYRRGDMMEKRRKMMADWQQFLKGGK